MICSEFSKSTKVVGLQMRCLLLHDKCIKNIQKPREEIAFLNVCDVYHVDGDTPLHVEPWYLDQRIMVFLTRKIRVSINLWSYVSVTLDTKVSHGVSYSVHISRSLHIKKPYWFGLGNPWGYLQWEWYPNWTGAPRYLYWSQYKCLGWFSCMSRSMITWSDWSN